VLDRWVSFSPVKNFLGDVVAKAKPGVVQDLACASVGEMDSYAVNRKMLALAGASVGEPDVRPLAGVPCHVGAMVVLGARFGTSLADIKSRLTGGSNVKIASYGAKTGSRHQGGLTSLVLDGDIVIESLTLAGSLAISAAPGARVVVKSLEVCNDGYQLEDRSTDADTPEVVRMRGFQLTGEKNTLSFAFEEPGTYVIEGGVAKKVSDTTARIGVSLKAGPSGHFAVTLA